MWTVCCCPRLWNKFDFLPREVSMRGWCGRALGALLLLACARAFSPPAQHARLRPWAPQALCLGVTRSGNRALPGARCSAGAAGAPVRGDSGSGAGAGPDRLWAWAQERGISLPSAEIGERDGMRGVIATGAGLLPGDAIVRLPRSCSLYVGCSQMCPFPSRISPSFWEQCSMSVRLALLLLYEQAQGPRSHLAEWLAALPRCHQDKPATWGPGEVAELQDGTLAALIERHNSTIHRIYEGLSKHPEHAHITRDDWSWAMHTVASRSFMGEVEGARETLLDRIVVALLMKLRGSFPGIIFAVPPGFRRWVDGTRSSSSLLLLEPMVDMLNHQTLARAETSLDPETDELTVRTQETWKAGEEVRIDYAGAKSNAKLLLSYGFVESNNPCNAAYLTENELMRAAYRVHHEGMAGGEIDQDENGDQEWEEAVRLLKTHRLINGVDLTKSSIIASLPAPAEISARGLSESCSAVLRALLCTQQERQGLKQVLQERRCLPCCTDAKLQRDMLSAKDIGPMCPETERRVARAAVYACEDAVAACATSLGEDQAILRDLEQEQDKGVGSLRLETAVKYRAGRKQVLMQAAAFFRGQSREDAQAGAKQLQMVF